MKGNKKIRKGMSQFDYIVAAGIFIIVFALVVQYVLTYYSTASESAKTLDLSSDGKSLITIADEAFVPDSWPELKQDNGMVLLMHFNNESRYGENRTFFKDFSGLGNNGTCTNCPYYNQSGKLGGAMVFDGGDDYVNVENEANFDFERTQPFSLSVWCKTSSTKDVNPLISKGDLWNPGWDLHLGVGAPHFFITGNFQLGVIGKITISTVNDNQWHHIVATYDGSSSNDGISVYIDGAVAEATSYGTTIDGSALNNYNVYIGRTLGWSRYFTGSIDEVAIYNRTLSASEVLNQYNYGLRLRRIGLKTTAYRFLILVNNTHQNYYNQSMNVTNLTNELISFNYTILGFPKMDYKSTAIYDENSSTVSYQISGDNITFKTNLNVNQSKWFTVYFDDDSIFEDRSTAITGTNNISEKTYPVEEIELLQYRKLMDLSSSNYTAVKNMSAVNNNFRIRLFDTNTSTYFMTFGDDVPRHSNIVALQRYMLFQNETGGIRNGKMIVQVW